MSLSSSSIGIPLGVSVQSYGVTASQFCAVAQSYDLARPDYPESSIKELVEKLRVRKESVVVDLGAGTGKLTKALLKHWNPHKKDDELAKVHVDNLVAIEVAQDMRTQFSKQFPNIRVIGGMAEDTRVLQEGQADFVIVGTAFHWFKDISMTEIARILKPRGGLGLIWNMLDPKDPENDWVATCRNLLEPSNEARNHDTGQWKEHFHDNNLFSNPLANHVTHNYKIEGTVEDVINCLKSFSAYAKLSPAAKEDYVQKVRHVLATHPKTKDKAKIEVPFRVEMYTCRKRREALKRSASPSIGGLPTMRALIPRSASQLISSQDDAEDVTTEVAHNALSSLASAIAAKGGAPAASESEDDAMGSPFKRIRLSQLLLAKTEGDALQAMSGSNATQEEKNPRVWRSLLAELTENVAVKEHTKPKEEPSSLVDGIVAVKSATPLDQHTEKN